MFGMSFFTKQEGHGVGISLCGNSVDILFIASNCFAFFTLNCRYRFSRKKFTSLLTTFKTSVYP